MVRFSHKINIRLNQGSCQHAQVIEKARPGVDWERFLPRAQFAGGLKVINGIEEVLCTTFSHSSSLRAPWRSPVTTNGIFMVSRVAQSNETNMVSPTMCSELLLFLHHVTM